VAGKIVSPRRGKAFITAEIACISRHIQRSQLHYFSQLERGAKRPRGATLKLLSLIQNKGLQAVL
jgi:DNA-binding transcriptional regulator YiaG